MSNQAPVQFSEDGQWWWDGAAWRSVAADPPPAGVNPIPAQGAAAVASSTGPASAAAIAVTWPQKFIDADPKAHPAFTPPSGGVVVNRDAVAVLALCLPFLALREDGVIDLAHSASKKMMVTFNSVKATIKQDVQRQGITGELLAQLKKHPDVDQAIRHWLGPDHTDPYDNVKEKALYEAARLGIYQRVDAQRNIISAAFKGKYSWEGVPDRVQAAAPEADRLAAAWQKLKAGEPVLADFLWKKVRGAIAANRDTDRGGVD